MLRRLIFPALLLAAVGVLLLGGWLGYCRGKAEGYLYGIESLSVLREFTPGLAEMSPDMGVFEEKLVEAIQMQEFYTLDEYLDIPAVFRVGMNGRRCADSTVAKKVERYRRWHREKAESVAENENNGD